MGIGVIMDEISFNEPYISLEDRLSLHKRFTCGGYCLWMMSIETDLSQSPPELITNFVGTESEAMKVGWELAPTDSPFSYGDNTILLCPDCAKRLREENG